MSRYKTIMCRNWETGTCNFKECTFAHGVEELRAPTRVDNHRNLSTHSYAHMWDKTTHRRSTILPGSLGSFRIENLLEMLYAEVVRERDLVAVHVEANHTLETLLRREQALHEETKARLEAERAKVNRLMCVVLETSEEIKKFFNSAGISEAQRGRMELLTNKMTEVFSESHGTVNRTDGEEKRIKELLMTLQQCQKPFDT